MSHKIEIAENGTVIIDGQNAGRALDCLQNYPGLTEPIQGALDDWHSANCSNKKAKESQCQVHENRIKQLQEDLEREAKANQELKLKIAEMQAVIDALGGTELGQQMRREARLSKIKAAKQKLEEEEAKLLYG